MKSVEPVAKKSRAWLLRRLPLHDGELDLRRILLRVMNSVVRHDALRFVVVLAASIHIAVETREVAARNLEADSVAGPEMVACRHRLKPDLIDLSCFHPNQGLIVPIAIAESLYRFIQVVGGTVRIYVDELHREVGVFRVRRHVKRDLYGSAYFDPFLEGLGGVYEDVRTRFHFALIE